MVARLLRCAAQMLNLRSKEIVATAFDTDAALARWLAARLPDLWLVT